MDIRCKTACGRANEVSLFLSDRPTKVPRYALLDSGQSQAVNIPIIQPAVTSEFFHGTPNWSWKDSSHIVTHNSKNQQSHSTDKNKKSHDSLQSTLSNNCSFKAQFPSAEHLQHTTGLAVQCSPSDRSCLSGGSPTSSQISQTFPPDIPNFQSADSGYSDNENTFCLNNALHELKTALLGPDRNDSNSSEGSTEEHEIEKNSEWSLEALNSITGNMYSEPEQAKMPGAKVNNAVNCVKVEAVNGTLLNSNVHIPKNSLESLEEKKELVGLETPQNDVRQLLIACAKAIADSDKVNAEKYIAALNQVVSVYGDPLQRLGAYMVEGLVARLAFSGGNIYKRLRCKEPTSEELLSHMHTLYEISPYFKFGYLAADGAIAEAFKHEDRVHIIDFQIAQGTQWITLIQALAKRPDGPPHVRVTGIDDPVAEYARGGGLQSVGQRLSELAASYNVPFAFHAVPVFGPEVQRDMLEIHPGETLAVNFPYQLHHMPDESVNTSNHRDRLLRMVKGLSPKVVTLVEQEANTNTAPFFPRFLETLSFYTAMFESLDLTLPRNDKNRINVEQNCLARDIVNVIACEGAERVERHEVLGKWRSRFTMAGFRPYPLNSYVNSAIKSLMGYYSENYRLVEKDEALYLGWLDRHLFVASAWH